MKTKFSYKDIHSCEALVLTCIDFRFWKETVEFAEKELGIKSFDFPSLPGAVKPINEDSELALKCISVPCDLHHVKKIVLINHQDCGAYGGSAKFQEDLDIEQKFHENELKKAKDKLAQKYPEKEIILIYAKLADGGENIEFVRVA